MITVQFKKKVYAFILSINFLQYLQKITECVKIYLRRKLNNFFHHTDNTLVKGVTLFAVW